MTTVKTTMVQRGHIYKWREGMPDERFVLTVGADSRGNEKAITVLMFNNSGAGRDVVGIRNNLLKDACYVHCGMVTYVNRQDLSEFPFHATISSIYFLTLNVAKLIRRSFLILV